MERWPKPLRYSEIDYNHDVLDIANEFHFRDERTSERYPDGYETHGTLIAEEPIFNLGQEIQNQERELETAK